MLRPDFAGTLRDRMKQLYALLDDTEDLIAVGSSFGGLMAACLAIEHPQKVLRLILLAPALNFHEFRAPDEKIDIETIVIIGKDDIVTPPDIVVPAAKTTFSNLQLHIVNDDHLLHYTYRDLGWEYLLK